MIGGGCQAIILLPALILPVFVYLSCLLLFPLKSEWKDALLGRCFALNCLLNTAGFVFSSGALELSQIGDANKQRLSMDAASGILLAAFFLSLICSSILLSHFL
jgi:hypothetical protein